MIKLLKTMMQLNCTCAVRVTRCEVRDQWGELHNKLHDEQLAVYQWPAIANPG